MSHRDDARAIGGALRAVVDRWADHLASLSLDGDKVSVAKLDQHQAVAYDLASIASSVGAVEEMLTYAEAGELEGRLAHAYAADVVADLVGRIQGRWTECGLDPADLELWAGDVAAAVERGRSPDFLGGIADDVIRTGGSLPSHLDEDREMVRDTFRRFAEDKVRPVAEHVHRNDEDIPDEVIRGLAELGCFGLSISPEHGGFSEGGEDSLTDMVVVTEELSRASLGVAGSLITRPEIIATAIEAGGTDEQKQRWLPQIASGERMCAVAVTEPDVGSDVASIKVAARRDGDDYVVDGVKTWCTFAGRGELLLLLARTDPDLSKGHRGLSLFVVEKPDQRGHSFTVDQEGGGGRMVARAIPTIGYRGMHSFEISFEGWRVPASALIGGDEGLGRGFYLQMQAFANGRLQTAARANGLMRAALEAAAAYTSDRKAFGQRLADYQLTKVKIARMAALVAACRQFTYSTARLLAKGDKTGEQEASMVKQLACRTAEWVTREAMQLHGGMGYAEEFAVSRYFVDARVLSIFEGADEILALRVIARNLLDR